MKQEHEQKKPLPVCPYCGAVLDNYIRFSIEEVIYYNIYYDEKHNDLIWEETNRENESNDIGRYYCPHCYSELPLVSEEDVKNFFKTGKLPKKTNNK